jgi:hypothetical protein
LLGHITEGREEATILRLLMGHIQDMQASDRIEEGGDLSGVELVHVGVHGLREGREEGAGGLEAEAADGGGKVAELVNG